MITAGVDVGAATAKCVILKGNKMISSAVLPTGPDVVRVAYKVFEAALNSAGLSQEDLNDVVATGYGRAAVPFANSAMTEIYCHARGAKYLIPSAEMIIDIGGQDSKTIEINGHGNVSDFMMNDKCAAGTGRFLEVMAGVLEINLADLGEISLKSHCPARISSVCTIFAESELVSLRAQKVPMEDIVAGIHKSVAKRVAGMASRFGQHEPVVFTGGVAKNSGVKMALEEELGVSLTVPEDPQIVGALGAALMAAETAENK